ncbi:MAG: hypothetical protein OEY14_03225, partial [Myxococcales bacterium]|nr:hypothetical protein [Myxococcales bacterium]
MVLAITSIAILTVMLAEMHEMTGTSYAVATSQRDRLQAEYMAKSGLNLTRLLVAAEPGIRRVVAPMYSMLLGRRPPQLPVWTFANELLRPFCAGPRGEGEEDEGLSGFSSTQGLEGLPGHCEIVL